LTSVFISASTDHNIKQTTNYIRNRSGAFCQKLHITDKNVLFHLETSGPFPLAPKVQMLELPVTGNQMLER